MHACPCHLVREQEWRVRDAPGEALLSPDPLWPPPAGRWSLRSLERKDRAPPPTAFDALRALATATGPRDHFGALNDKPVEASNSRRPAANRVFPCPAEGGEEARDGSGSAFAARRSSPSTPLPLSRIAQAPARSGPPVQHRGRKATRHANWSGADRSTGGGEARRGFPEVREGCGSGGVAAEGTVGGALLQTPRRLLGRTTARSGLGWAGSQQARTAARRRGRCGCGLFGVWAFWARGRPPGISVNFAQSPSMKGLFTAGLPLEDDCECATKVLLTFRVRLTSPASPAVAKRTWPGQRRLL